MAENDQPDWAEKLKNEAKRQLPKRFYKLASVQEAEGGFAIALDGRLVKTPMNATLSVPGRDLAEVVAGEWNEQGEFIDAESMPLTKLANTAIDRVETRRGEIVSELVQYTGSDLLCYRADAPAELVSRQENAWDPVLQWGAQSLGIRLICVSSIMPAEQPAESMANAERAFQNYSSHTLTGIHNVTTLTGSAMLALAMAENHISADDVWRAAHIDDDWNIEHWGDDEEAALRRTTRKTQFDAVVQYMSLVAKGAAY